jgi:hypothetical protein
VMKGNAGNDRLSDFDGDDPGGDASPDSFFGGTGYDTCSGDPQDSFRGCEVISKRKPDPSTAPVL